MSRKWTVFASVLVGALLCTAAFAHPRSVVEVEIVDADGAELPMLPVASHARHVERAYLAAERGQRYRIRVRNTRGHRVGLVIAVDGRNIISGARSELAVTEPMYILDAWQSANYSGWRANLNEVNEFYFTEWRDSYAEAFGDASAPGVIAVAVFLEQPRLARLTQPRPERSDEARDAPAERDAPTAAAAPGARAEVSESARAKQSAPGTGYGDRRSESVREVQFVAQSKERARVLIKYEWHEHLCRTRGFSCEPQNRLWDQRDSWGFAPPPPRRAPAS